MSHYATEAPHANLIPIGKDFAFISSFDRNLVDAFKQKIPPEARSWDKANRRWLVSAQYAEACAELAESYLGVKIRVPKIVTGLVLETKLIRLEYLGRCKERDDGTSTAFGWADGGWSVIIPEMVLRDWFAAIPQRPDEMPTLYAVLAVKQGTRFDEIRTNYRRLVKQWHPDVCHEPNAAETFKTIQHAYEILQDDAKRKKYDAGLEFQASMKRAEAHSSLFSRRYAEVNDLNGYRSPLRCGYVLAEGTMSLGRLGVTRLLGWEDIVDAHGRTMIVSWPFGAKEFEVQWS